MASSHQDDEDFNYDKSHKMQSSVGNFLKEMQQRASNIPEKSYGEDLASRKRHSEKKSAQPRKEAGDRRKDQDRGRKGTYYCDICNVTCNSSSLYDSHVSGKNHQKKMNNSTIDVRSKRPRIATLRDRLAETPEPLVGLHHIEEVLPSNPRPSDEAFFSCSLCCISNIGAIPMFTHVTGIKHRQKYVEMKHGEYDLERHELTARSFEIERSEGRNLAAIVTLHSDDKYPAPRPMTSSSSSTPVPPPPPILPGAKSHANDEDIFTRRSADPDKEVESLDKSPVAHLIKGLSFCAVKNDSDAQLSHTVAKKLIRSLVTYKHRALKHPFTQTLENDHRNIVKLLDLIYEIPSPPALLDEPTPTPSRPVPIPAPPQPPRLYEDNNTQRTVAQPPVRQSPVRQQPPMQQPPVRQQPPMQQPPVRQSPMQQPPMQQPPVRQPPMQQPPMQQPPVRQPPMQQPLARQQPMQQPPMQQPPVRQQPNRPFDDYYEDKNTQRAVAQPPKQEPNRPFDDYYEDKDTQRTVVGDQPQATRPSPSRGNPPMMNQGFQGPGPQGQRNYPDQARFDAYSELPGGRGGPQPRQPDGPQDPYGRPLQRGPPQGAQFGQGGPQGHDRRHSGGPQPFMGSQDPFAEPSQGDHRGGPDSGGPQGNIQGGNRGGPGGGGHLQRRGQRPPVQFNIRAPPQGPLGAQEDPEEVIEPEDEPALPAFKQQAPSGGPQSEWRKRKQANMGQQKQAEVWQQVSMAGQPLQQQQQQQQHAGQGWLPTPVPVPSSAGGGGLMGAYPGAPAQQNFRRY